MEKMRRTHKARRISKKGGAADVRTKAIVRLCTHLAHSVHRSQVPNRQSCDCINFVRATDPFLGSGSTLIAGEKKTMCAGALSLIRSSWMSS